VAVDSARFSELFLGGPNTSFFSLSYIMAGIGFFFTTGLAMRSGPVDALICRAPGDQRNNASVLPAAASAQYTILACAYTPARGGAGGAASPPPADASVNLLNDQSSTTEGHRGRRFKCGKEDGAQGLPVTQSPVPRCSRRRTGF